MSDHPQLRRATRLQQRAGDSTGATAITRDQLVDLSTVPADEADPEYVEPGWRAGKVVAAGITSPARSEAAWSKEGHQAVCLYLGDGAGNRQDSVPVRLDCEPPGRDCCCGIYFVPELADLLKPSPSHGPMR